MMITMDYIMNATEEIAASRDYTNIKMLKVFQETADDPLDDLEGGTWPGWYTTADSGRLDLVKHDVLFHPMSLVLTEQPFQFCSSRQSASCMLGP